MDRGEIFIDEYRFAIGGVDGNAGSLSMRGKALDDRTHEDTGAHRG